jgi:hypothetical protein
VQYNKVPFTASFGVLSGLIKPPLHEYNPNSPENNAIPTLDIQISSEDEKQKNNRDDMNDNDQNMKYSKNFSEDTRRAVKNIPRLKFSTVYVPFIQGIYIYIYIYISIYT